MKGPACIGYSNLPACRSSLSGAIIGSFGTPEDFRRSGRRGHGLQRLRATPRGLRSVVSENASKPGKYASTASRTRPTHDHDLRSRATASSRAPSRGIVDNEAAPLAVNSNNQNFMTRRSSKDRAAAPSPPTGIGRRRRSRGAHSFSLDASGRRRWPRRPRRPSPSRGEGFRSSSEISEVGRFAIRLAWSVRR